MKTNNPYSINQSNNNSSSSSPKISKGGYQFWGITISNIPSSTNENQIGNEFKKYGDIFSVKSTSSSSMNIIFKSPKKPNSITDIINEQKKFKVTPLESQKLNAIPSLSLFSLFIIMYISCIISETNKPKTKQCLNTNF